MHGATIKTLHLVYKTNSLIKHREIFAVCSEIHPKHINTACEHNLEFFNVRPGGTFSNYGA